MESGISRAVRARVRDAPPLARGRTLPANRLAPIGTVDCDALIAENDENEVRKAFTVSERVAIAAAVAERLKGRAGGDRKSDQGGNISTLIDQGKTRDLAAAKAGLGSGKTLEAAQAVVSVAVSADWGLWTACSGCAAPC